MELLALKNLINRKLDVEFYYNFILDDKPGLFCRVNNKIPLHEFINNIKELKEKLLENLISLESMQIIHRILSEYQELQKEFSFYTLEGQEYIIYNNLKIFVDKRFLEYGIDYFEKIDELTKKTTWKEEDKIQTQKDIDFILNSQIIEIKEISNIRIAESIDRFSRFIYDSVNQIISFINQHFNIDSFSENKGTNQLSVKQQILILNYLFTHYQNSEEKIPNNKLSQLLGFVLDRNNETIRSLLTYMPRVEDNEADDKIAKTPKNLTAVNDLFVSLKIKPLQMLVERDIEKMKKINK